MALAAESETVPLPQVVVVGTTPVSGVNIDANKVAANVQTVTAAELRRDGATSLINGLNGRLSSLSINDTLADPFQPDLLYRGFEASPVLGTPQGLAVYQNGVRINEAFGDTVNWDLVPDLAIARIDIVSANPLFGLNALGGAVSITMKNGFDHEAADAEAGFGSFKQRYVAGEFGANNGTLGIYGAARSSAQDGWRLFSHDSVHQYYFDASLHVSDAKVDLSYARANNMLFGQGAAPVQSLALNPSNVFTGPQSSQNDLDFTALNGSLQLQQDMALQTVLYLRNFRQGVANGDRSDYAACVAAAALCQADGTTALRQANGAAIPDITDGGATVIGQNDFEKIHSRGWGGSLQLTDGQQVMAHGNQFAMGAVFDLAKTDFHSGTQLGPLDSALRVEPTELYVFTAEDTAASATPVSLNARNRYYGVYLTDTLDLNGRLSATASVRYNVAEISLVDQLGTALSGGSRFGHINPALGVTYQLAPAYSLYLGYSINNRVPTASEIECSDPQRPCLLPSSLAGDPPNLRQVIAHTLEAGVRGHRASPSGKMQVTWNASVFRTDADDDIYGVSTSASTGFFENVGATRRQGFESSLEMRADPYNVYLQYSYIEATFRSALTLNSPSNPFQDDEGNIEVRVGDRLPLIPAGRLKLGADVRPLRNLSVGATLSVAAAAYYRGDESNQNPQLPGYQVLGFRASYQLPRGLELFATVENLFNERYSTYGLYSDPSGVGAPGIPAGARSNDPRVDNRFQSPAMPRAYFVGIKISK